MQTYLAILGCVESVFLAISSYTVFSILLMFGAGLWGLYSVLLKTGSLYNSAISEI